MKKILLIGGGGYVGTIVISHFLKLNYSVNLIDNFVYNNQFAVSHFIGDPDFTLFAGDMGDVELLKEASDGVSDVIILGGLVGDPITKKYPEESTLINDIAIKRCIDFFDNKNIEKLIFISTCSNYGLIKENEIADEDFKLNPLSLYAKAKVENEFYLLNKKGKTNYSGVILRFATAFGLSPRMRFDLTVNEFTKDIFFGEELLVYDENTWRPYCHVRDFARLLEIVIKSEKEKIHFQVFNAGGDVNNYTKKMIVDEILKHIPEGKVKYGKNGSDPRNYRVSFAKVKDVLGFYPKYSVADGIKELITYLRKGFYADAIIDKEKYGNYSINLDKVAHCK